MTAAMRTGLSQVTASRRMVIDPALSETFLTALSDLNRLVRTRMLGGVGRAVSNDRPYPIRPGATMFAVGMMALWLWVLGLNWMCPFSPLRRLTKTIGPRQVAGRVRTSSLLVSPSTSASPSGTATITEAHANDPGSRRRRTRREATARASC